MRLESGPAAYDRNYNLVVMLLGLSLGGYFYYDHIIGYPHKNHEAAVRHLTPLIGAERIPEKLPEIPSEDEYKAWAATEPSKVENIPAAWGQPLFESPEAGGVLKCYASAYGMVRVPIIGNYVDFKKAAWVTWEKSKDDIQMQLYCAIAGLVFGLFFLWRGIKAASLKVIIDEEGLKYGGRRVAFAEMTKLTNYSKKGWVDLFYNQGGPERKIRFDNQKVRKFDEIIDALCSAKGFADPRKAVENEDRDDEKK